jgi:hypothetical protein
MEVRKYESACDDGIDRKFQRIVHNKNQHYLCGVHGVLSAQVCNLILLLIQV